MSHQAALRKSIDAFVLETRHESHRDPRLSDDEADTAARLVSTLRGFVAEHPVGTFRRISVVERVGGTGVLLVACGPDPEEGQAATVDSAVVAAQLRERPVVLLRAELDGLPIDEAADPAAIDAVPRAHRSRVPGVSMKCGHDGHHASMIGAFLRLAAIQDGADANTVASDRHATSAAVALILQPAEETGLGARRVVKDPAFLACFAQAAAVTPISYHNVPGLPLGAIRTRVGTFAKASTGLLITMTGRTAHAATPEHGVSPAVPIARAVQRLQGTVGCELPASAGALCTITHFSVGEATFGVAPGAGRIHLTMRADKWDDVAAMVDDARTAVAAVVAEFNDGPNVQHPLLPLAFDVSLTEDFRETANDAGVVAAFATTAEELGADFAIMPEPMSWSEDFGVLTAHFGGRGAMVALGAGETTPALHTICYDYPDALLPTAMAVFEATARRLYRL